MIPFALLPLFLATPSSEVSQPVVSPAPLIADEELEGWSGDVTAGAIITSGNTKTKNATVTGSTKWKRDKNAFSANVLWNFQGDQNGVIQRKLYGLAQYDRFLAEKTYAYGNTSADSDYGSNLDLRYTLGAGLGHEFRNDETWSIDGEFGLSYVDESYKVDPFNPPASDPDAAFIAARIAYGFTYNGSETWGFYHSGQVYPSLENADDIFARLDTGAKTNLTETMFAQIQWVFDYDNTPAPDTVRKSSLIALTLGWSF